MLGFETQSRRFKSGGWALRTLRFFCITLIACLLLSACTTVYEEGQVWQYQTRPGEEGSRLYIVKIDQEPLLGAIYHLYLDGLRIRSPLRSDGVQDHLPHLPVDQTTLDRSVTELVISLPNPPAVADGYAIWRESYEAGEAGVFNIPVSDIIQIVEDSINQPAGKR